MIYILFILIVISGIAKSISDTVADHYDKSIFPKFKKPFFWNKEISWKNKYKNQEPQQGERFLFSTTIFVWLTDAWHLFNMIQNTALIFAIIVGITIPIETVFTEGKNTFSYVILFIILKLLHTASFQLFYKNIWIKK